MKTLTINSKLGNYDVVISDTAIDEMEKYIKTHHSDTIFVIYDSSVKNVKQLIKYNQFDSEIFFIPLPTKNLHEIKSWDSISFLVQSMFSYSTKKNSLAIAIGGAETIDVVGFVSTIIHRGINFIYCPTTLSCSVDACVGEEIGINYKSLKNIIGTFANPSAVFIDLRFLKSLSKQTISHGICLCIKHALICDEGLLYFIQENCEKIYDKKNEVLEELIYKNLAIKNTFLTDKLYDKKIALSLGNIVCDVLLHIHRLNLNYGEPLSLGIIVASRIANEMKLLSDENLNIISDSMSPHFSLNIETGHDDIYKDVICTVQTIMKIAGLRYDISYVMEKMMGKGRAIGINMVLPVAIGKVEVHSVTISLLSKVLSTIFCK